VETTRVSNLSKKNNLVQNCGANIWIEAKNKWVRGEFKKVPENMQGLLDENGTLKKKQDSSESAEILRKENIKLKKKIAWFKKMIKTEELVWSKEIAYLKKQLQNKCRQTKELSSIMEIFDDDNMKLKNRACYW